MCRIGGRKEVAMVKQVSGLLLLFAFVFHAASASAEEVDLELVIAMDGSGSISAQEYLLQLDGTADAFRDPAVQTAIASGPVGRIAVSVLLWSDAAFPKFNTGWHLLDSPESANRFASVVRNFRVDENRRIDIGGGGGTGIGAGVEEALKLMRSNNHEGLRKVIDVSGDGIETEFWFSKGLMIRDAKLLAEAERVTVNGLPILNQDFPQLDRYYREEVISGPGAFVVVADGFRDFKRAIRKKLLREISSNISALPEAGKRNLVR